MQNVTEQHDPESAAVHWGREGEENVAICVRRGESYRLGLKEASETVSWAGADPDTDLHTPQ